MVQSGSYYALMKGNTSDKVPTIIIVFFNNNPVDTAVRSVEGERKNISWCPGILAGIIDLNRLQQYFSYLLVLNAHSFLCHTSDSIIFNHSIQIQVRLLINENSARSISEEISSLQPLSGLFQRSLKLHFQRKGKH